ncbi:30S ribosomal protein S2 [Corynebacterium aquatimens]|uniref:30S ribosomal protein S2 n=1 Tax=Corynebacterium TaxID=1716 RepID=UPI001F3995C1|nr:MULTISPECIES: 30S ribosomal protein S2 [Corynebacterium]QYH19547.1 30S ribosomal protein S2 [Corynebacterium aquatimens]UIZ91495.1 30S ribosomal protein S2 [Corynebacterium sp. CNCTC7651]
MAVVTMRELLDAGVHFGHQTRRWNPKMRRFIFTDRNGIYIIDLQQTLTYIDEAYEFVKETVAHGGTILFVGTKKQAQEPIQEEAERVGMPYVTHRWLGGMLTNFQTVSKRIARMKELQAMDAAEDGYAGRGKKEVLMLNRERVKLERVLGGISDMTKAPSALWIVDTNKEHIAVSEAEKLRIPVVAVLDTNCDPDVVDYPIPGNDDAIRSVKLLTSIVGEAVIAGKQQREERQLAAAREAAGDTDAKAQAEASEAAAQAAASSEVSAAEAGAAAAAAEASKEAEAALADTAAAEAPIVEDVDASPSQISGTESATQA